MSNRLRRKTPSIRSQPHPFFPRCQCREPRSGSANVPALRAMEKRRTSQDGIDRALWCSSRLLPTAALLVRDHAGYCRCALHHAAFFELLAAAAGTGIVTADMPKRVCAGLKPNRQLVETASPLSIVPIFIAECIPGRQFRNRVAEEGIRPVVSGRDLAGMCDCKSEVAFENDESRRASPKPHTCASANVLVGRPIEDDVVKRSGIAIEHSRYDPVTGGDGCVAQNIVYVRRTKQTGERAICGFLAPTTEKVKDEEKLIPARWALGRCSEKCLNFP